MNQEFLAKCLNSVIKVIYIYLFQINDTILFSSMLHKLLLYVFKSLYVLKKVLISSHYGNTGYGVSSLAIQTYRDFCLKINISQGYWCILRIGVLGRCQKVTKFDFQSQFSMSKIVGIIPKKFFIEKYEIRSTTFINDTFCLMSFLKHFIY